jgi:spoIIIJ-associated protein
MTDFEKIEKIKQLILELLHNAGFSASVEFEESATKGLVFNILSEESYMLIGKQGATLHALQILIQALVSKKFSGQEPLWFSLDVDDYKRKREWYLKETAKAAAEKLKNTGRSQGLEPMPAYERRFVHSFLQENEPDVFSESDGQEPYRRIILRLKK